MDKIVWDFFYSVGVKSLDEQHRKIIEMINNLIENKENLQNSVELAANTLEEMSQYAAEHFKAEERLMEEHKYPGINQQKAQHISFRKEIVALGQDIIAYGKVVPSEGMEKIIKYLHDWWINHIQKHDTEYTQFFNEKGIW